MTDVNTLVALLRTAAPALAVGSFLEEAAELMEANDLLDALISDVRVDDIRQFMEARGLFSDYLVSIGMPAIPIACDNPHLEALAEILLP